jgi:hypothetical protein
MIPLPRDEDGFIKISAEYGEHYIVAVTYNRDADGHWVDFEDYSCKTLHGPMSWEEAEQWVIDYPEDKDLKDIEIWTLNRVRPAKKTRLYMRALHGLSSWRLVRIFTPIRRKSS